MKKKVFRERYADSINNLVTYTELIENPKPIEVIKDPVKEKKTRAKEEVKEEPKKRGRKSVKSDK